MTSEESDPLVALFFFAAGSTTLASEVDFIRYSLKFFPKA
jgi:hypothetical protein